MPIVNYDDRPTPGDYLEHYGKRGMRWGHRKKYSTANIKSARKRLTKYDVQQRAAEDREFAAKPGSAARKKAQKDFDDVDKKYLKDPDRAIAMRMTRGEKVATLLIGGPLGAALIGVNSIAVKSTEKKMGKK